MTADPEPQSDPRPDPRTAPEEDDVPNEGESAETPAEGDDSLPAGGPDSPA